MATRTRLRVLLARLVMMLPVAASAGAFVAAPAAAATVPPGVVVVNQTSHTLTSYPLSASGDAQPAATLTTNSGGNDALGVALNSNGDGWVSNFAADTLVEYSKAELAAGGDPTPLATITATNGSLSGPIGATFDAAGDLWVANSSSNTIVEYTAGQLAAGGAQTPVLTLSDDGSGSLSSPAFLAFDAAGDLWVPNENNATVVEFRRAQLTASGDPAPAITISSDSSHDLETPVSITFDSGGNLWATDFFGSAILEFTPAQQADTGTPSPATVLRYPAPGQAQFDAAGDLWVAGTFGNAIAEFDPAQLAAGGTPTPADTIQGADTGLSDPSGLAVEQAPTVSSISADGGPSGTPVTISGTGFYPGSTVDFGTTAAASVTYVSPYELTAVAPAGSGTVDVTVSTGEGTSATSPADQFAYPAPPVTTSGSPGQPIVTVPVLVPHLGSVARMLKVVGHLAGVR